MKGERVGSAVRNAKALGNELPKIPHPALSNQFRLIPTNSRHKKIKSPSCPTSTASICFYLGINSPSQFRPRVVLNRIQSCRGVLKKVYFCSWTESIIRGNHRVFGWAKAAPHWILQVSRIMERRCSGAGTNFLKAHAPSSQKRMHALSLPIQGFWTLKIVI
jgi:hypothetical protein